MKNFIKNIEQIESYHEGRMSAEEKVDFEIRLLVDADLAEENELYIKIMKGFLELQTDQIRTKLKLIDKELDRGKVIKRTISFNKKKRWMLLATTMVTIIFVAAFYFQEPQLDNVPLPTEEGLPVLMDSNNLNVRFDDAMQHFKNNEFDIALSEFTQLLTENPKNDTLLYFTGITELYIAKHYNAIRYMKLVSQNTNSTYSQKADYFLAYCYYQTGSIDSAKYELNRISQFKSHIFEKEAERFLQMLDAR